MTVALVVGVLLTAACRGQDTGAAPDDATNPAVAGMTPTGTPTAGTPGTPPTREPGGQMDIRISGASLEMRGTLEDTVTARDFAALLPLTLTLNDFAGTEKVADLPVRLDTTAAPAWHTGRPGDITYYAPWGNLALFHGSGPRATGLVRLGRLEAGAAVKLAQHHGEVTITRDSSLAPT